MRFLEGISLVGIASVTLALVEIGFDASNVASLLFTTDTETGAEAALVETLSNQMNEIYGKVVETQAAVQGQSDTLAALVEALPGSPAAGQTPIGSTAPATLGLLHPALLAPSRSRPAEILRQPVADVRIPVRQVATAVTKRGGGLSNRYVDYQLACLPIPRGFRIDPASVRIDRTPFPQATPLPQGPVAYEDAPDEKAVKQLYEAEIDSGCYSYRYTPDGAPEQFCVAAVASSAKRFSYARRGAATCTISGDLVR